MYNKIRHKDTTLLILMFYMFTNRTEPMTGFEPVTSSLPRKCSTAELHRQKRAEDGAQTRDPQLGRLMLYQLSYFRKKPKTFQVLRMWAKMDSNHRSRKTADLQSAPFGHSGICPTYFQRTTASQHLFLSLLSDSNQRPRDYKSRALAN